MKKTLKFKKNKSLKKYGGANAAIMAGIKAAELAGSVAGSVARSIGRSTQKKSPTPISPTNNSSIKAQNTIGTSTNSNQFMPNQSSDNQSTPKFVSSFINISKTPYTIVNGKKVVLYSEFEKVAIQLNKIINLNNKFFGTSIIKLELPE